MVGKKNQVCEIMDKTDFLFETCLPLLFAGKGQFFFWSFPSEMDGAAPF
ncbi:hypothetical protein [Megalodesulfovibrio paquesii]